MDSKKRAVLWRNKRSADIFKMPYKQCIISLCRSEQAEKNTILLINLWPSITNNIWLSQNPRLCHEQFEENDSSELYGSLNV